MARSRKITSERKALITQLLESYKPEDITDVHSMLKDLLSDTLKGMLEAELDKELRYSKYDYVNKDTNNSKNGYSKKSVLSSMGDLDVDIPRDRNGDFDPQVVKKHQTDISTTEDQVLSMYAIHYSVRQDNSTIKKAIYIAIGIKLNGSKAVLGMWVGGNESAKYWLGVLN